MKTLFLSLLLCACSVVLPAHSLYDLKCEHLSAPMGIDNRYPIFSWKTNSDTPDYWQQSYRIQVESDGKTIWDSGKVRSDESANVHYAGPALRPATHYRWRVRTWGSRGERAEWSEWQPFSTALLSEADWHQAQWIALELDGEARNKPDGRDEYLLPLLRTTFNADKPLRRATAYVCGLGHFELFLNGLKAHPDFLAGGWTLYDKEALYLTLDLTDLITSGRNAIAVMLGNGFYHIPRQRYHKLLTSYGAPKLRLLLRLEYADGTVSDVTTNTAWRTTAGPITYTSIYGGEDYDATLNPQGWMAADYDDSHWQQALQTRYDGELHASTSTPVVHRQEITVKKTFRNSRGHWVFDLGQNFSGILSIAVRGERGQQIRLHPSELLEPDSTANQRATGKPYYFSYRLAGNDVEHWQPQFTYYGFRYVEIEGALPTGEDNPDNLPVLLGLTGIHTANSAAEAGTFTSSSTLMNQIHTLIDWAMRSNMQSVLTDCPHREKLGWIEQDHLMQPSILYRYDLQPLYGKILRDMQTSQRPDGCIPSITPEYTRFADGFEDSPEWGSAFIISPWYLYQTYGDPTPIRRHYPAMKRYLDYLTSRSTDGIIAYGLGDWYDIGPQRPGYAQLTSNGVTCTAIYYYDILLMEKMATLLGYTADAEQYAHLAATVKAAFRKTFISPDTHHIDRNSQTANAIALFTGILEPDEADHALQQLISDIQNRGNALTAGDIGYRYVLASLSRHHRSDIVYDMNSRTDVPGYGWQLAHGATALTESWQAYGSVSNNHFMLGHLMEWLYAWLGGIRQQENSVGFRHILIAPQPVGDITSSATTYESPYGPISCTWQIANSRLTLNATIPPNTTAKILLPHPDGTTETHDARSGHHVFDIPYNKTAE